MSNTTEQKRQRAHRMLEKLAELFPEVHGTALSWETNWELIVAVILSAQTTDKQVNTVTPELFKKYESVGDYAAVTPEEFAEDIQSIGLYRNKANNIVKAARMIRDEFDGEVPDTIEELTKLPGVARKSANVILNNAFGKNEGIAVDTHVKRFARKFDLTEESNPDKIERDLMEVVPREEWGDWTHRLIEYGRKYCPARKHDCSECPLTRLYPPAAAR